MIARKERLSSVLHFELTVDKSIVRPSKFQMVIYTTSSPLWERYIVHFSGCASNTEIYENMIIEAWK